jgi:hypothetical protein
MRALIVNVSLVKERQQNVDVEKGDHGLRVPVRTLLPTGR